MNTSFERLVRFRAKDGRILYGEAGSVWEKDLRGQVVKIFNGSDPFHDDFKLAGEDAEIAEVLSSHRTRVPRHSLLAGSVSPGLYSCQHWDRSELQKAC